MSEAFTLLDAVTATGTGTVFSTDGASSVVVQVYSASTSSCTVLIEQSLDGSHYETVATITDPSSAGETWAGPALPFTRANVSARVSGTLSAKAIVRVMPSDSLGTVWKKITTSGQSIALGPTDTVTAATFVGDITGDVTGNVTGDLTGNVTGNVTGDVTGDLTGDVVGDITPTTSAISGNGAIGVGRGFRLITKGSALGSSTLATPTATTHDGYELTFTATTAYAHVISTASGKVNGGTNTTITFGGAIGDSITLTAYQGVWYSSNATNVVVS